MPEFQDRDAEHHDCKNPVLASEIEMPELDTDPHNLRGATRPTISRDGTRVAEAGT